MAHRCIISGKGNQFGNRVSHAKNRTRHTFKANLQSKKIYVPSLGRTVRMKISTEMLRTIDKNGIEAVLKKHGVTPASLI